MAQLTIETMRNTIANRKGAVSNTKKLDGSALWRCLSSLVAVAALSASASGCAMDLGEPSATGDGQWVLLGSVEDFEVDEASEPTTAELAALPHEMSTRVASTPTVAVPEARHDDRLRHIEEPDCEPLGTAWVTVRPSCSWGICPGGGDVVAFDSESGKSLASGEVSDAFAVPAGCPFDLQVTLVGLLDAPTFEHRDLLIPEDGMELTIPLDVETGTIQFNVRRDGEPTSAIVYLHRLTDDSTEPSDEACGSTGAWANSQEIMAGRYFVRALSQGDEVTAVVTIDADDTRAINLDFE